MTQNCEFSLSSSKMMKILFWLLMAFGILTISLSAPVEGLDLQIGYGGERGGYVGCYQLALERARKGLYGSRLGLGCD